jgi:hypothetical protein
MAKGILSSIGQRASKKNEDGGTRDPSTLDRHYESDTGQARKQI